eukprot:TRINITY_DN12008_c0_g1_i1.p1 TRINITY_DN12008_c0_g1~~TRINITY_DN12008_c0_g1_i1.p1  ORF type:complete len:152 (-),score=26.20 TRINITY_DN12008_c0_g1_i1:138-593(-)
MQRGLVGSEMCIRDSINAEYMGNMERLKRIQEYNRQRVIEKHSALEEKLREKKKNSAYFQQYIFRKESYERETAQLARELLSRLAKLDPNDQKEQKKLIKTLRAMNSKFSLGLPVSFFRKYLPAPKKEEIQPKPQIQDQVFSVSYLSLIHI